MKYNRTTRYIILLAVTVLSLSSCINDDLMQCVVERKIYFDYTPYNKADGKGVNIDEINKINLYAFDAYGNYVKEYVDEHPAMGRSFYIDISDLPQGKYQFIAWGNLGSQYALAPNKAMEVGKTQLKDLQVQLDGIENGRIGELSAPLFFATHLEPDTIEIINLVPQDIHLRLINNTYKINVEATGLDSLNVAHNAYRVDISDNNGIYDFHNNFVQCRNFDYTGAFTVAEDVNNEGYYKLNVSLDILRLNESRKNTVIKIVNSATNEAVITGNLVDLIMKANETGASISFDRVHEFDIRFEFDPNSPLNCSVYVNGYKIIDQGGQILN